MVHPIFYIMISKRTQTLFLFLLTILFTFSYCKKDDDDVDDKQNQPPVCVITAPQNGAEFNLGDTILIQVNASDPDGDIMQVRFFIDGTGIGAITTPPFEYSWYTNDDSLGYQNISALSIDNLGMKSSDNIDIVLSDATPKAAFTADSISGEPPLLVQFIDQSTNSPTSFYWDFGDGNSSTDQNPLHVYVDEGVYNVSLKVSNNYASDSLVKYAYIIVQESPFGSFTDPRDGQTYETITIGKQVWLAENLNFKTKFSGYYDNLQSNGEVYGSLYPWEDAMIACPSGWHLPSNEEWMILEMNLGMTAYEAENLGWRGTNQGTQMKAANGWDNNGNGTNTSWFTALPGGYMDDYGMSYNKGLSSFFWTSTDSDSDKAWRRILRYDKSQVYNSPNFKTLKFSVRCLKD